MTTSACISLSSSSMTSHWSLWTTLDSAPQLLLWCNTVPPRSRSGAISVKLRMTGTKVYEDGGGGCVGTFHDSINCVNMRDFSLSSFASHLHPLFFSPSLPSAPAHALLPTNPRTSIWSPQRVSSSYSFPFPEARHHPCFLLHR